jgi:hypothetical protein
MSYDQDCVVLYLVFLGGGVNVYYLNVKSITKFNNISIKLDKSIYGMQMVPLCDRSMK